MINLLSPADKKELRAARRNTIWSRYTFLIIALLVAVNVMLVGAVVFIQTQAGDYQFTVSSNEALAAKQYAGVKTKAEAFRKNLITAKAIIDSETSYSTVISSIGYNTPHGCILTTLALSNQSFGVPQTLSFSCKSPNDILNLKTTLEKAKFIKSVLNKKSDPVIEDHVETSHPLFSNVNIVSTTIGTPSPTDPNPYVVSISMSVVIIKPPSDLTGATS
jgi:hypothetical protein